MLSCLCNMVYFVKKEDTYWVNKTVMYCDMLAFLFLSILQQNYVKSKRFSAMTQKETDSMELQYMSYN